MVSFWYHDFFVPKFMNEGVSYSYQTFWIGVISMAKKKREHIVFDQMLRTKKSIPFGKVNKQERKTKGNNITVEKYWKAKVFVGKE